MLLDDPFPQCGNGSVNGDGWNGKAEGHRGLQTAASEDQFDRKLGVRSEDIPHRNPDRMLGT